jgi:hypothetical protein
LELCISTHKTLAPTKIYDVGFEVFTAVVMKSIIFWDMTPCSPLSFNRCFGGTYRLFFRVEEISSKNPASKQMTLNRLHGVISQKIMLFKIDDADGFENFKKFFMPTCHFVGVENFMDVKGCYIHVYL